jgi:predicted RNA binding protein YcfA (HicA-like mRNA interferase family)/predicted RNase H-like HicB family nuclease
MNKKHAIHIKGKGMKTYVFRVVIEPDEDRWSAHCPALLKYSAVTWGNTQEEALKHIQEVVQLVVEELMEDGEPIPEDVQVSQEPLVAVTLWSMAIDYSQLRSLTAREIITALIRDGFFLRAQAGSHQRYRHPDGRRVTVSFHHPRDTFPFKTLKSMIEDQARWTEADLRRLGLLPWSVYTLITQKPRHPARGFCNTGLHNPPYTSPPLREGPTPWVWAKTVRRATLGLPLVSRKSSAATTSPG